MRILHALLLATLLLAGVPAPSDAAGPTVVIHETFAPGEWIVIYVYVMPTPSVSFTGTLDASTQAPLGRTVGLFTMPPTVLTESASGWGLVGAPETPLVQVEHTGGTLARHETLQSVVSTPGIAGVQLGFAATHAWRLDLVLTVAQATFATVYRYDGATFSRPGYAATPVAGTQTYDLTIPNRGWTHLSMEAKHLQPDGLRSFDVRFPNGFRSTAECEMSGVNAVAIGVVTYNDCWGGFGATSDVAGTLRASVTYTEASTGVPLAMVHMPWPPQHGNYDINYRTLDGGLDIGLPS